MQKSSDYSFQRGVQAALEDVKFRSGHVRSTAAETIVAAKQVFSDFGSDVWVGYYVGLRRAGLPA